MPQHLGHSRVLEHLVGIAPVAGSFPDHHPRGAQLAQHRRHRAHHRGVGVDVSPPRIGLHQVRLEEHALAAHHRSVDSELAQAPLDGELERRRVVGGARHDDGRRGGAPSRPARDRAGGGSAESDSDGARQEAAPRQEMQPLRRAGIAIADSAAREVAARAAS